MQMQLNQHLNMHHELLILFMILNVLKIYLILLNLMFQNVLNLNHIMHHQIQMDLYFIINE